MSTLIKRTLDLGISNAQDYGTYDSGLTSDTALLTAFVTLSKSLVYYTLNSAAMNELYPNATAKPAKADYYMRGGKGTVLSATVTSILVFNGTTVDTFTGTKLATIAGTDSDPLDVSGSTNSAIRASNRSSTIKYGFKTTNTYSGFMGGWDFDPFSLSLYFYQYSFSATAGSNVTSVSVSSSTGFDGDKTTFSCTIPTGSTFDGWYSGSTKVSTSQTYTHTVNGADLTLQARATEPVSKSLSATYNGSVLSGFPITITEDTPIYYNGSQIATFPYSGDTKTLICSQEVMDGNISIGGKTLQCSGYIMASDVVFSVT